MDDAREAIRRERSAIRRYACSRPIGLGVAAGMIVRETSVLDYGCGHGGDVQYLRARKISAWGWDPHYAPAVRHLQPADVVNLGYVLNVIESLEERSQTLHRAFELTQRVLIVAVRVDRDLEHAQTYADGVLTSAGTFQKLFSQSEFLDYLARELKVRPHAAALGIALVFKDPDLEREYLARQAFAGSVTFSTELLHRFEKDATARRYVSLANRLGRVPTADEFGPFGRLVERFGSPARLRRLLLRHVDSERFAEASRQRREDVLTFLAMLRFRAVGAPLGQLPPDVREDIRSFWPTYTAARAEGETFLFSMGDPQKVASACAAASVGKLLPKDLYVHRTAEEELPPILRLLSFAAKQLVGEIEYDLVKLSTDGRAVSFLRYPDFDTDPHPALAASVRIYLPKGAYDIRDYRDATNPPILHRKDALVSDSHPLRGVFQELTRQEEAAGLLSQPDIGLWKQWHELLAARGMDLQGHELAVRRGHPATAEPDTRGNP